LTQAEDQANSGVISDWSTRGGTPPTTYEAWDMTSKNPCPGGYRVPTFEEWVGVETYNTWTYLGSWLGYDPNDYTSAAKIGNSLLLPAAGYRNLFNGNSKLEGREGGLYWSASSCYDDAGGTMVFSNNYKDMDCFATINGMSVRCIAE